MGDLKNKLGNVEEDIQLLQLAEEDAKASDQDLIRFEESFRQLQLQQRLVLEGEVRRNKLDFLAEMGVVDNTQDLVDKALKTSLKREESLQIHLVKQKVGILYLFSHSSNLSCEKKIPKITDIYFSVLFRLLKSANLVSVSRKKAAVKSLFTFLFLKFFNLYKIF